MNQLRSYVLSSLLLPAIGQLYAQESDRMAVQYLRDLHDTHFHLRSTPFNEVQVLDNRVDTVTYYIQPAGFLPAVRYTLEQPASVAIREFLQGEMATLKKKGNETLLLNIRQLRIPNLEELPRHFYGQETDVPVKYSSMVFLGGEAYYKVGPDRYRLIVAFDYHLPGEYHEGLPWMLNRVLAAAGQIGGVAPPRPAGLYNHRHTNGDSGFFTYATDTASLTLNEINRPERSVWAGYGVWRNPPTGTGIFRVFDDFREGQLRETPVDISYNDKDSLYVLTAAPFFLNGSSKKFWPYVVADSGRLFINVGLNYYVPLLPDNNTFSFYIPPSLPDMSRGAGFDWPDRRNRGGGNSNSYDNSSFLSGTTIPLADNLLADLGAIAFLGLLDLTITYVTHQKAKRRPGPPQEGPDYNFRHCIIDMDSGDFIY